MLHPFANSSLCPSPKYALQKVPEFVGNPHWDHTAAFNMVDHMFRKQVEINVSPPTWSKFQTTIKVPKSKATYHNGVPPHLTGRLPPFALWPLCVMLCHAWQDGGVGGDKDLLALQEGGSHGRGQQPIAVSSCVYQVLCKILLQRMKTPLTAVLLPNRNLHSATTYQDYLDLQGNNDSDTLTNMRDNLPMDLPAPKPHNIILHGHIMPTPAKSWIMQLGRQKQTADVHWVS